VRNIGWEHWQQEQETLYSCAIITTRATDFMQPIHERMPVIMPSDHYSHWLDKTVDEYEAFELLDNPAYKEMVATPVSDWVNNPRHNDKRCLLGYDNDSGP